MNTELLEKILNDKEAHREVMRTSKEMTEKAFREANEQIARWDAEIAEMLEKMRQIESKKTIWQKIKEIFK